MSRTSRDLIATDAIEQEDNFDARKLIQPEQRVLRYPDWVEFNSRCHAAPDIVDSLMNRADDASDGNDFRH
jgi:hypothetical protein